MMINAKGEAAGFSPICTTPICDFVCAYAASNPARLHMPGHKGRARLGFEPWDITEIDGADNLFAPEGIIAESEANASRLFGARTLYSTEGSSLALRAMLFLAVCGQRQPVVLAARNAHRAFLTAAALLDFEIAWLPPAPGDSYHSCTVAPESLEAALTQCDPPPRAVYLTSPDYLGHVADIAAIAAVCHRHSVLLLVDNAHGAYLKFLTPSRHPIDLGADMCCDSAHKTLPAVTGAAYLHLHARVADAFAPRARDAMALFGSTSPSYLIMQSLDACNPYLCAFPERLAAFAPKLDALRARLTGDGWRLVGNEPLKLTLDARARGLTGDALAERLARDGLFAEFHDPDFLTLMLTPENPDGDLARLEAALNAAPRGVPLPAAAPPCHVPRRALSPRQAMFAPREPLPAAQCLGRVLASANVSCPPAVPIAMAGEIVDEDVLERFEYYGIQKCDVVKEV